MPNPASTSMSQINTHIGSNRNSLGDSYVRNLSNQQSGANSFGKCRWGISLPAYQVGLLNYNTNADIYHSSEYTYPLNWESVQNYAQCALYVNFFSNGTAEFKRGENQTGDTVQVSWTWLTSGSAGDYKIRVDVSSGAWSAGSSSTGTDLALSTTRGWVLLAESNWSSGPGWQPSPATASVAGTITIKDSGGSTLISRSYAFDSTVYLGAI